ncbi:MAG: hypothetical protein EPN20_01490 [Magnetospirillum sp.]|nr:MAG: hypothetical protein EPN20_01490 [Magnetospirillum sp.]
MPADRHLENATAALVNELTLLPLAVRVLRRRPIHIVMVDPLFPPLRPLLERAARWLVARGARWLIDSFPEDRDTWNFPNRIFSHDVLAIIEPWQNRFYRFDRADSDRRHGYALKLLVTNFVNRRYVAAHVLAKAVGHAPGMPILGLSPALDGVARAWLGSDALGTAKPAQGPVRLINLLSSLFGLTAAAAFALIRLRPSVRPVPVFVLADHDSGSGDLHLLKEFQAGGEVALAMRNRRALTGCAREDLELRHFLVTDGVFDPAGALAMIGEAISDSLDLFRRYGDMEPALFHQLALLPYRRALLRGLFNRCRPKFFWARDDYNVEHVIRRQELNRIGAPQYGLNHAIQGICILLPQTRYVSMDVYFTMGRAFHPYFRDSWAKDMVLRPVGGYQFSRAYFQRPRRRTNGILFMARFATGEAEFVRAVRMTAQAFPDRPIWIQTKRNYPSEAVTSRFTEECRAGLANVSLRSEKVYDMILDPEIIVTDPSTIVGETIQLKIPTVVLDVIPEQKTSIFRSFPRLCVTNAEDCVARLRGLLDGTVPFDPAAYGELIDLAERPISDAVLAEMGLAAAQTSSDRSSLP